jgi:hypothetical protein
VCFLGFVSQYGDHTHSMPVSKRRLTKGTRNFNIDMCLIIFAELGFEDGPRLVGINIRFTLWSKITILQSLIKNTSLSDWSWKQMVSTNKIEGPTSKFFYLGLPNSVLEPTYLQSRIWASASWFKLQPLGKSHSQFNNISWDLFTDTVPPVA